MNWKRGAILIFLLSLIWLWQQWPDGKLRVVFCDVGQGDAALVVLGSFQALIDTGPSESKLFSCLAREIPFWDRKVELVLISHPQKDHNGALGGLRERYRLGKVVESAGRNDRYGYAGLYFDILSEGADESVDGDMSGSDENEKAMVVSLKYLDFSALFTADIGEEAELALLDRGVLRKINLLKVPHHGSKFSSSNSFLEVLRPDIAVVSVGAKNSYGHPNVDTLMRLEQVRAKILRTDMSGSVGVVYDGRLTQIFTER